MKRTLAAALVWLLAAASAYAQPPPQIAGGWAFETSAQRLTRCVISGEALIRSRREPEMFDVEMRAAQRCPDGRTFRVEESCVARRAGTALTVACTLVSADPGNYNADQFSLTIQSADTMQGRLVDHGAWNEPVRWRKTTGALVS